MSHAYRGATVSDHATTTGLRGHLAEEEVGVWPKKEDGAILAVISLGCDSTHAQAG